MDMKKNFQIAIKELVGDGSSPAKSEKPEKIGEAPKPQVGQSAIERLKAEKARRAEPQDEPKIEPKVQPKTEVKEEPKKAAPAEPKSYKEIQEMSTKTYMNSQESPAPENIAPAVAPQAKTGTPYDNFSEREDKNMTIISEGTSIQGNITTNAGIKIHGNVDGDISSQGKVCIYGEVHGDVSGERVELVSCRMQGNISAPDSVIVSQDSKVVGDITANTLRTEGKIKGNVVVQNGAELSANAVLLGNLTSAEILIEKGAVIRGEIKVVIDNGVEDLDTNEEKPDKKEATLDDFDA